LLMPVDAHVGPGHASWFIEGLFFFFPEFLRPPVAAVEYGARGPRAAWGVGRRRNRPKTTRSCRRGQSPWASREVAGLTVARNWLDRTDNGFRPVMFAADRAISGLATRGIPATIALGLDPGRRASLAAAGPSGM